jgi:hypothetical protein
VPASTLLNEQLASDKRIGFSSITGYWWQGDVNDITFDYRGYRVDLGKLYWQWDWHTLPSSRWCIRGANSASKDLISAHFRLCYLLFENRLEMLDTVVEIDAKTIAEVSGLEVAGQWLVTISSATAENNRWVDVYGEAVWKRAQWHNGEEWFVLGDILSTFDANQQSGIAINTTDIDGPLQVELTVMLSVQQEWTVSGFIEPYGKLPLSLADSLTLASTRVVEGRYHVDYQWR